MEAPKYLGEFKKGAVALLESSGKSVAAVPAVRGAVTGSRRRAERAGALAVRLAGVLGALVLLSGCDRFVPSDPLPKPPAGARWDGDRPAVFLPHCPADRIGSLSVFDMTDSARQESMPPPYWTGSEPTAPDVANGFVTLGAAGQFAQETGTWRHPLPTNIGLSYKLAGRTWGGGAGFVVGEIPRTAPGPDMYWTPDGGWLSTADYVARWKCPTASPSR